jgi:DNA-binding XRE family transcriptional regulator
MPAVQAGDVKRGPRYFPLYKCKRCGYCHSTSHDVDPAALRAIRLRLGVTQQTLAAMAGIGRRFICDVEQGNRRCPDWLLKFYLNVDGITYTRKQKRPYHLVRWVVLSEIERFFRSIVVK